MFTAYGRGILNEEAARSYPLPLTSPSAFLPALPFFLYALSSHRMTGRSGRKKEAIRVLGKGEGTFYEPVSHAPWAE